MTERKHKDDARAGAEARQTAAQGGAAAAAEDAAAAAERGVARERGAAVPDPAAAVPDSAAAVPADPLSKLAAERDEYLDHLQRLKAEFENYRKRVRRDGEDARLRATEGVVESLLPVMDNMQRALTAARSHEEGQLVQGVELVADQLRNVLSSHGLEEVKVEAGTVFDPNVHDAVLTQPSDEFTEGSVLQVLEPGYLLHGRLLRPAKVIVVK